MKIFSSFTICLFLIFFAEKLLSQSTVCPEITTASSTICAGDCAGLTATVTPINATTSYGVGAISYNPNAYTGGTAVLVNQDDVWSPIVNLPFNFCFFGNTYNRVVIGANGVLTFDATKASTGSGYVINNTLPTAAQPVTPANSIAICCRDIDPSNGGSIGYYIGGTAPCRYFVLYYNNVPLYNGLFTNCSSKPVSKFQLVLYESTNLIDVYIANSTTCTFNNGYGIIGIQNIGATTAVCPAGRNRTTFTAVNEAWRFSPTGAAATYTVSWAGPSGNVGTGLGPVGVCPISNTTYTASLSMTNCDGSIASYSNTAAVIANTCITLPIEGLNFNAIKQTDDVLLKWATTKEINSSYFEIERSTDAQTFSKILGNVTAAGNSNANKNYTLVDPEPYNGINYYRLKQVDLDGIAEYSNIISIDFYNSLYEISIVPQPASQNAELIFKSTEKASLTIDVYDLTGRKIIETLFSVQAGRNVVNLDLSPVNTGLYFLTMSKDNEIMRRIKLLKE